MQPSVKLLGVTQPLHESYADVDGMGTMFEVQVPVNKGLDEPLDLIEYAGRWDYGPKSIGKMGDPDIIRRWLITGEESMIEMVDSIFLITCSRVVSHELVRHRIASYQQESQRFVAYEDEEPDELCHVPEELVGTPAEAIMRESYARDLTTYKNLRLNKVSKQLARYVLPNSTRTRVIMKANLREWRHILRLRLHTSAQPEMRQIMKQVHEILQEQFGTILFPDDIAAERAAR